MLERIFGKRIDNSDQGLRRAAEVTAKLYGSILRGGHIDPEVQKVVTRLNLSGLPTKPVTISDEATIVEFQGQLTEKVIERVLESEKRTCIGCPHESICHDLNRQMRPCVQENPDIDSKSMERFVGSIGYEPIGVLGKVADNLAIPHLAFPFKTGVYVNRGRLINLQGEELILKRP